MKTLKILDTAVAVFEGTFKGININAYNDDQSIQRFYEGNCSGPNAILDWLSCNITLALTCTKGEYYSQEGITGATGQLAYILGIPCCLTI